MSPTASEVANEDLRDLMRLLGMSLHARDASPHEVFQKEVLPEIERLLAVLDEIRAYVAEGMRDPHEQESLEAILRKWAA